MGSQHQPRRYYSVTPVGASCWKGFRSLQSWSNHKNTVHGALPSHPTQPPQHPYVPKDVDSCEEDPLPEGAFYVQHPILDGEVVY